MATFEVTIHKIKIEDHPNADALELAVVGDYRSIVRKGQYTNGDLVAYIPEAAIVPDWLITQLGLEGRLAGKAKNRVKAVKLRGVVSQGLCVPCVYFDDLEDWAVLSEPNGWKYVTVGSDVTEHLEITKWEPPIPVHMAGEVQNLFGHTMSYDIENYKKHPDILIEGEKVIMTEKLHGTWACWGWHPNFGFIVASKGLSGQGLCFKDNEANDGNLYLKTLKATTDPKTGYTVAEKASGLFGNGQPVYLLGEIFGGKVQDLKYGLNEPEFRLFDIYIGEPGHGRYMSVDELWAAARDLGLEIVPVLYCGPFNKNKMLEVTNGKETISGTEANIREGIVVRTYEERRDSAIGRVQLKSISDAYLLRKGGTEFT